ncbi:filamentous hemagglutinin N-terminal domain-containing protein, partial [Candidatus Parabeggiatoa sp. HSG14]|uniref:two-partner secretion domain-containing protein n=1 Tax=Candidatus Parabeggiatoa sp. HSG14 TaxID=3055593 RepID=UPI0025A7D210|nr:filamentous hemagglutinin N-terminal domain-containing protein [Thiotrichales bacterium HSG14]
TTDGSLGSHANLPGPDYLIGADLGSQLDGNLFHSFQDFNLNSLESATFSGPNNVQNILSRVTGGNPSNIDGLIRSTIPNADMYFMNPYGIMFGPNAQLDVQGSFHASTADYLRLGNDGRFDVRNPSDSLLTVEPVEAFGFLDAPAPISIQRHGQVTKEFAENTVGLSVPEGKTLSLIGGNIEIGNGTFYKKENGYIIRTSTLLAPSGRINLSSVASKGEVKLDKDFVDVSSFAKFADISLNDYSIIEVNGEGGGKIFIRGGQMTMDLWSNLDAETKGDINGALIDIHVDNLSVSNRSEVAARTKGKGTDILIKIQANDFATFYKKGYIKVSTYDKNEGAGDAGTIVIEAPKVSFAEMSGIYSSTVGSGNAGDVIIRASKLFSIENDSSILVSVFSSSTGGNAGTITIEAKDILMTEGSNITTSTYGIGKGGQIDIVASGKVTLSGVNENGFVGGIFSDSNPGAMVKDIAAFNSKAFDNDAGSIVLKAKELVLEKGAIISSSSISREGKKSGKGGDITLLVDGTITLDGINLHGESHEGLGSGIYVRSLGINAKSAGNIKIEAKALNLIDGAVISSTTDSHVSGGNINIKVEDNLSVSGDSTHFTLKEPLASQINFKTEFPEAKQNYMSTSGIYSNSESSANNAGIAGNIVVNANTVNLTNGGFISTSAQNSGGGFINMNTPNLLLLEKGSITTSVHGGIGDGGNINIVNPRFTVLNQAYIVAQADEGHGGDIHLKSEKFITSPDSLISASSRLGIDGEVKIDSPTIDMNAFLVVLPAGFVEAQLRKCTIEKIENPSTFKVNLTHDRRKELPFGKFLKFK